MAASLTARNAAAADRTVSEIVANIKKGTVDPKIEAAAIAAGIIQKKPAGKRSLLEARANLIKGPKGQPHDTSLVAQHVGSGGYVPDQVKQALISSKHYLVPGQSPNNPTAPPKQSKGKTGAGRKQKGAAAGVGAVTAAPGVSQRDLSMELYERDLYDQGLYERDLYDQGLYERDFYDQGLYERDLYEPSLYERAIFERDPEAMVTYDEIKGLAKAVGRNPKAGKAVFKALTMDPNVEQVTEKLVADWLTDADMEKREAEAYESYLLAREAEPEAEAEAEADAEADAEAYESYLEARDADPEADAEAEAEAEDLYIIEGF